MTTLLVVDDDEAVAEAVRFVLEQAGHVVVVASDIASARKALAGGGIDACILDVWMDTEDGLSLGAEIGERHDLPIIVMSGGGSGRSLEQVSAKADAIGAVAFLFKPFDDDELLDAVSRAL